MNSESLFSIGLSSAVSARVLFAGRRTELEIFENALAQQDFSDPVGLVEDLRSPRRNVLVFHGPGGIGKTRLSLELNDGYLATEFQDEQRACFRLDFDEGGSSDLEGLLLGLRATLGLWKPAWPAFDLAFAVYWERAHPGVPLQTAVDDSSAARGLALGTQLQQTVENLLESPDGVLDVFTSAVRLARQGVKERLTHQGLEIDCPFFPPIVEETDPAAMRSYLVSLLAWELARYQRNQLRGGIRTRLVVFFDTWEQVQNSAPCRGDTEDLLSRLVHLMPNALFVITGRNRLGWAGEECRGIMQWSGPEHWPTLSGDVEPAQHLLRGLSSKDAGLFLRQRLIRGVEPAIPPPVRDTIARAADGLPLYLELAAIRFEQAAAGGTRPGDAGQPFAEIVTGLIRELDVVQRDLLRTASLMTCFDEAMLRAGAPDADDAAMLRFLASPFVRRAPVSFSLHESLREAVRRYDVAEDRWKGRQWALAAGRLRDEVHRRTDEALDSVDSALLAGLFKDAVGLTLRVMSVPHWLWQLAARLLASGHWEVLAWTDVVTPSGSVFRPAATALTAIARRFQSTPARTASVLSACLDDVRLDPAGWDYVSSWLGRMLEADGRSGEAERVRLEVALRDGPFAAEVRHTLGQEDWMCGRLERALTWEFDESDPSQSFWAAGIRGRVAWILGRFDEAEELFEARLQTAERLGSPELVAHALRTRGELRCFTVPGYESGSFEAVEIYVRLGNTVGEAEARESIAVARAGLDPAEAVVSRLHASGAVHADVGEVFVRCIEGDVKAAQRARDRLVAKLRGPAFGFWAAITAWWLAELGADVEHAAEVEWLHGEQDARERWVGVLKARIADLP